MSAPNATWLLFDFGSPGTVAEWHAIDDRVMGGISSSRLRQGPAGHAVFEGTVSLERNGGFASIRSTPADRGRPDAQTCFIEARTTAKRFKLNLLTDAFDSINYQATFTPEPAWQTLPIPLANFRATFRGREVPAAPALDPARIRQVGLLIAELDPSRSRSGRSAWRETQGAPRNGALAELHKPALRKQTHVAPATSK